jgi:proteasome accessory factor C
MAKTSKEIQRLLTLLAFLNRRRGVVVDRVARELGVTRAQLLKDLDQLSMCGVPPFGPNDLFMATVDEDGRLDMAYTDQFRSPLHLTPREAIALRTALAPLTAERSGPFSKTARGIIAKLDRALLPQDRQFVDNLDQRVAVEAEDRETGRMLETLQRARSRLCSVEITYYTGSSGELGRRVVDPYGFVLFGGSWYLVGFCHKAKAERTFKVERVKEVTITGPEYKIPDSFDIAAYSAGHLFRPSGVEKEVRIRFSPAIARWILERSSLARRRKDGSAEMTLMAGSFAWIARWILQYGAEAEVLAPEEARAEVRKILAGAGPTTAKAYGAG